MSLSDEEVRGYLEGAELVRADNGKDPNDVLANVIRDLASAALNARSAYNLLEGLCESSDIKYQTLVIRHDELRQSVMRIAAHLEIAAMHDMKEVAFGGPLAKMRKTNAEFLRGEAGLLREAAEELEVVILSHGTDTPVITSRSKP